MVLHVATAPALLQTGGCCARQSEGVIQLATCQESSVRGERGALEFQTQAAVKLQGGAAVGAFTHWVPPARVRYPERELAISASRAHSLAILLMYADQIGGVLAYYDTPMGLIWEMWARMT